MTTTIAVIIVTLVAIFVFSALIIFYQKFQKLTTSLSSQLVLVTKKDESIEKAPSLILPASPPAPVEIKKRLDNFVLVSADERNKLEFTAIENLPTDLHWRELSVNGNNREDLKNLLSGLQNFGTSAALMHHTASGLFQATGNLSQLIQLKSGGFGTAVRANGTFSHHAGFVKAGSSAFTPLIIFQLAALVTGQYYLHGINKQLTTIQQKLDKLLNLFHIERQAKLKKSFLFLSEFQKRSSFEIEDFVLMKNIISDLADIREEYFMLLSSALPELQAQSNKTYIRSITEIKKLVEKFEETKFLANMEMSIAADKLFHVARLIELHMNISFKNPAENRITLIHDKFTEYSKVSAKDFQFNKTEKHYGAIKKTLTNRLQQAKTEALFSEAQINKIHDNIYTKFTEFEKKKHNELKEIEQLYRVVTSAYNEPTKFIIDNSDPSNPKFYSSQT